MARYNQVQRYFAQQARTERFVGVTLALLTVAVLLYGAFVAPILNGTGFDWTSSYDTIISYVGVTALSILGAVMVAVKNRAITMAGAAVWAVSFVQMMILLVL